MPSTLRRSALVLCLVLAACGGSGGGGGAGAAGGGGGTGGTGGAGGTGGTSGAGAPAAGGDPIDPSPLAVTGTIAYVRDDELRLVEPDGTGDRLVWKAPPIPETADLRYEVRGAAWRPDGREIAFTSDHEDAFSPYGRDLYAIRPDGKALRKITNGPTRERMSALPKGSVRVRVTNASFDAGPFFVLLLGGEPQLRTIAPGSSVTLTFDGVADLGDGIQPLVVATGAGREAGVSGADVKPGEVVDSIPFTIHGDFSPNGARDPFWSADGARLGFFSGVCILQGISSAPPPGASYRPLVDAGAFVQSCGAEWGPTPATAGDLLMADSAAGDGTIQILRVREGATAKPGPVTTVNGFHTPDLHWIRDGSGFHVATSAGLADATQIFEYRFATGRLSPLTAVRLEAPANQIRRFAVSPDGRKIVFERTDDVFELTASSTDLWIMDRDGSNARLLAAGGRDPSWNPAR